jgi:predicted PurR-regulated permease PerM
MANKSDIPEPAGPALTGAGHMTTRISGSGLRRQVFFWIIVLAAIVGFLMLFRSILLPFVAGMALAYFLDPVADWFERRGLSRLMATIVILVSFLVVFTLSLMIIIPLLATQAADFISKVPGYITTLQTMITDANAHMMPDWLKAEMGSIKENFAKILGEGAGFLGTLLQQIWNSGMALIDIASLLFITPVVAFYLLLDWDRMVAKVDSWIPRNNVEDFRTVGADMNAAIAGFVRGQGSICLILGVLYAVSLSLAGLNFGLLIGLVAGMISFIPYVGSIVGLFLSVGVALVQFWPDYPWVIVIAGIFLVGQFIDGNILQPKLVGQKVGLHPVWLMFSLMAFSALFGFVGLLVAVPVSAAIGVLVRFGITRYLDSNLYVGEHAGLPREQETGIPDETDPS